MPAEADGSGTAVVMVMDPVEIKSPALFTGKKLSMVNSRRPVPPVLVMISSKNTEDTPAAVRMASPVPVASKSALLLTSERRKRGVPTAHTAPL